MRPAPLPRPDEFGNFWLGKRVTGPAIFLSRKHPGKYFASEGAKGELLWNGNDLRYFDTPGEAYWALEALGALKQKG